MSTAPDPPTSSFRVPGYRYLWLTGWMWHVARWMAVFATTFRVNEQTGNPLLVQLVGTAFMAPMFLGGAVAGTMTDRLDRHRTVARTLRFLIPVSGLMGLAVGAGQAPVGVSYLFMFLVGTGNVIDMTSRRTIAFGLVGAGLITNAAAFETLALHGGNMVGSLAGGAVIQGFGAASAYGIVGLVYVGALTSFVVADRVADRHRSGPSEADHAATTVTDDFRAAFGLLRRHTILRQFLMTTVLMNFFYYSFMPLVPVFAEDLGVGAFQTGLLASALGAGTMTGALVVAKTRPTHRGLLHVGGSIGAMAMLIVFANLSWYPAAVAALFVAGLSGSGFGTTQAALVVSLVDEQLRGRALGVLSMAIGALPFGMFSLGLFAQHTDPQRAVTLSVTVGIVVLIGWHSARPELRALR